MPLLMIHSDGTVSVVRSFRRSADETAAENRQAQENYEAIAGNAPPEDLDFGSEDNNFEDDDCAGTA